ncbi:MAG: hypothetical protein COB60_00280 [Flavobacteriaceae bacterium]|nr:MAG: hypothetical protein COB60_00280 [Flavobacteriaceae bacterium]
MLNRTLGIVLILSCLCSCTYFEGTRNTSVKAGVVMDTIVDLKKVDVYPMYGECADLATKDAQWECSQKKILNYIKECIDGFHYSSAKSMNDTLIIQLHISNKGAISILPLASKNSKKLGQIKAMLMQCADSIPLIQPAIKRAIPVSSTFTLPIIIKN